MKLNDLAKEIHKVNVKNGFYEGDKNIGEMLCLVHSEVSEALEADRKGAYCKSLNLPREEDLIGDSIDTIDAYWKNAFEYNVKDTFEDEIADAIIRLLDISAYKEMDIESHIKYKLKYNSMREYKHGKKY